MLKILLNITGICTAIVLFSTFACVIVDIIVSAALARNKEKKESVTDKIATVFAYTGLPAYILTALMGISAAGTGSVGLLLPDCQSVRLCSDEQTRLSDELEDTEATFGGITAQQYQQVLSYNEQVEQTQFDTWPVKNLTLMDSDPDHYKIDPSEYKILHIPYEDDITD